MSSFNLTQDSTTQYEQLLGNSVCYDSVTVNNKYFTNPTDAICFGGSQTITVDGGQMEKVLCFGALLIAAHLL